jgi:glycosyltransferase involved in cell wall biosynthesis
MKKKALISIIIPTYNSAAYLETTLESVRNQTYDQMELIVVDSAKSVDKTAKLVKKYNGKYYQYGNERSMQRNFGVSKSAGEYVVIIDSDMKLNSRVIEECVQVICSNSKIGAVIIPEQSYGEGFWAQCKALERNCYIGDDTIEAARFFKKSIYVQFGGFNENMISGEDWDLTYRIRKAKIQIGRVQSLIHHNEGRINLIKDIKKKLYYAKNADSYLSNNQTGIKHVLLFIFRPAYFRNWKLLVADPVHFLGFMVMKFLEIFVGGMMIVTKKTFWVNIIGLK